MAKKIGGTAAPEQPSVADQHAAEALAILHPEQQVLIANRPVMVREYGYIEGLRMQRGCPKFLDALYGMFARASAPPSAEAVADVIAEHIDTVQWLIAQSITPLDDNPEKFVVAVQANVAWIGSLSDIEGDALMMCWWGVNAGFFIRRLQRRLAGARLATAVAMEKQSRSSASTAP